MSRSDAGTASTPSTPVVSPARVRVPETGALQAAKPSPPAGRVKVLLSAALLLGLLVGAAAAWRILAEEPAHWSAGAPSSGTWPEAGASRAVTQVRPDGVLEVTHWIHAADPLHEIALVLPHRPQGRSLKVSTVEVVADDLRASGPAEPSFGVASYVFVDATHIRVRYELSGAVEMSTSAPGRGLVTTTALEVSPIQHRDIRVVRSAAVLALACAPSPRAALEPCGESRAYDEWMVQLSERDAGARIVAVVTVST